METTVPLLAFPFFPCNFLSVFFLLLLLFSGGAFGCLENRLNRNPVSAGAHRPQNGLDRPVIVLRSPTLSRKPRLGTLLPFAM